MYHYLFFTLLLVVKLSTSFAQSNTGLKPGTNSTSDSSVFKNEKDARISLKVASSGKNQTVEEVSSSTLQKMKADGSNQDIRIVKEKNGEQGELIIEKSSAIKIEYKPSGSK